MKKNMTVQVPTLKIETSPPVSPPVSPPSGERRMTPAEILDDIDQAFKEYRAEVDRIFREMRKCLG
jgi:hypothetical protein